jgi:hypothetical protein
MLCIIVANLYRGMVNLIFDRIAMKITPVIARKRGKARQRVIVSAVAAETIKAKDFIFHDVQRNSRSIVMNVTLEIDGKVAVGLDAYNFNVVDRPVVGARIEIQPGGELPPKSMRQQGVVHSLGRIESEKVA